MEYKSITEAAKEKQVSRQAIHAAILAKHLNSTKIGNQHAILVDSAYKNYEPNRNIQEARKKPKKK